MSETEKSLEEHSGKMKDKFWTRPFLRFENDLIIEEEKYNKKMRTEGKLWRKDRDLTKLLLREIVEAYEHRLNTILLLDGLPGMGKTEAGKSLAKFCVDKAKKYNPNALIHWNFGFQETVKNSDVYKEYDVIEQDEEQRSQGMDANSVKKAITDLQEIAFRENKNTYIVSKTNAMMVRSVAHIILESFAGMYESRISLLKVYSAKSGLPLGIVKVPLLKTDDIDYQNHLKREKKFKAAVRRSKGYTSTLVDEDRISQDKIKLFRKIFKKYPLEYSDLSAYQKRMIIRYGLEKLKNDTFLSQISGSEKYQTLVMRVVWDTILEFKDLYKDELELQKIEIKKEKKKELEKQKEVLNVEIAIQKREIIPLLIEECSDLYFNKKVKPVQLRSFYEEKGIFKENLNFCLAKTYDLLTDLENEFNQSNSNDRQAVSGDFIFTKIKNVEDPSFYDKLADCYTKTIKRIKTKKLKKKHFIAWFTYYRDHVSVDNLALQNDLKSKSSFTNTYPQGGWFSIVKEEILGHLVEDALTVSYYQGFKVIAGKTEADLFNGEKMIEVKARSRRESPAAKMLNQKEVSFLDQGGLLELCLVTFKPGKCDLEFYSVERKTKESFENNFTDMLIKKAEKELTGSKKEKVIAHIKEKKSKTK